MSKLQLSNNWRLEQKREELYVSGGQDSIYTIDLGSGNPSFFASLKPMQEFTKHGLKENDKIVLEQLLSAGVITPRLVAKGKLPSVSLIGNRNISARLVFDKNIKNEKTENADLLVFVRTNQTLREFLNKYNYLQVTKPHLLLDLAYNHIISLGPLVFPSTTSCLACLEGRVNTRWGDEKPPMLPKSSVELVNIAREWLNLELKKIFNDQDYFLVNKTIVIDTNERSITHNKLLTVPLCPYCNKSKLLSSGKLEYNSGKANLDAKTNNAI